MGQFSWITQDTFDSIRNNGSVKRKRKAFMHDNNGNTWEEKDYEGYGIFGGKDFYQLLAEMNEAEGLNGDIENDRSIGIDLYFGVKTFGTKTFISPNLTRSKEWTWIDEVPKYDPNQGWGE